MQIIIMGFKHTGKSSIAKSLAQKLTLNFYDIDELSLEKIQASTGKIYSIRSLFAEQGSAEFYRYQQLVYEDFINSRREDYILALGGGACMAESFEDFTLTKRHGKMLISLEDKPALIYQRMREKGLPPYLKNSANPQRAFILQLDYRNKVYRSLVDYTCKRNGEELEESIQKIAVEIRNYEW